MIPPMNPQLAYIFKSQIFDKMPNIAEKDVVSIAQKWVGTAKRPGRFLRESSLFFLSRESGGVKGQMLLPPGATSLERAQQGEKGLQTDNRPVIIPEYDYPGLPFDKLPDFVATQAVLALRNERAGSRLGPDLSQLVPFEPLTEVNSLEEYGDIDTEMIEMQREMYTRYSKRVISVLRTRLNIQTDQLRYSTSQGRLGYTGNQGIPVGLTSDKPDTIVQLVIKPLKLSNREAFQSEILDSIKQLTFALNQEGYATLNMTAGSNYIMHITKGKKTPLSNSDAYQDLVKKIGCVMVGKISSKKGVWAAKDLRYRNIKIKKESFIGDKKLPFVYPLSIHLMPTGTNESKSTPNSGSNLFTPESSSGLVLMPFVGSIGHKINYDDHPQVVEYRVAELMEIMNFFYATAGVMESLDDPNVKMIATTTSMNTKDYLLTMRRNIPKSIELEQLPEAKIVQVWQDGVECTLSSDGMSFPGDITLTNLPQTYEMSILAPGEVVGGMLIGATKESIFELIEASESVNDETLSFGLRGQWQLLQFNAHTSSNQAVVGTLLGNTVKPARFGTAASASEIHYDEVIRGDADGLMALFEDGSRGIAYAEQTIDAAVIAFDIEGKRPQNGEIGNVTVAVLSSERRDIKLDTGKISEKIEVFSPVATLGNWVGFSVDARRKVIQHLSQHITHIDNGMAFVNPYSANMIVRIVHKGVTDPTNKPVYRIYQREVAFEGPKFPGKSKYDLSLKLLDFGGMPDKVDAGAAVLKIHDSRDVPNIRGGNITSLASVVDGLEDIIISEVKKVSPEYAKTGKGTDAKFLTGIPLLQLTSNPPQKRNRDKEHSWITGLSLNDYKDNPMSPMVSLSRGLKLLSFIYHELGDVLAAQLYIDEISAKSDKETFLKACKENLGDKYGPIEVQTIARTNVCLKKGGKIQELHDCGSPYMTSELKQVRSADEGQTQFLLCRLCGAKSEQKGRNNPPPKCMITVPHSAIDQESNWIAHNTDWSAVPFAIDLRDVLKANGATTTLLMSSTPRRIIDMNRIVAAETEFHKFLDKNIKNYDLLLDIHSFPSHYRAWEGYDIVLFTNDDKMPEACVEDTYMLAEHLNNHGFKVLIDVADTRNYIQIKAANAGLRSHLIEVNENMSTNHVSKVICDYFVFNTDFAIANPKKTPEGRKIPKKYLKGLNKEEMAIAAKEIDKGYKYDTNDPKAYEEWKSDIKAKARGYETVPSKYKKKFIEMYGPLPEKGEFISKLSKATGIKKSILKEVEKKGLAAWRTGHRVGANQHAWARGRVYSFVTLGNTVKKGKKKMGDYQLAVKAGLIKNNPHIPNDFDSNRINLFPGEAVFKYPWLAHADLIKTNPHGGKHRTPKKYEGQDPSEHSDLFTDEDPKGTIKGLGFKDKKTATESIKKIEKSKKPFAHKMQAAMAMEQRARFHAHQTPGIKAGQKVYAKWIKDNKRSNPPAKGLTWKTGLWEVPIPKDTGSKMSASVLGKMYILDGTDENGNTVSLKTNKYDTKTDYDFSNSAVASQDWLRGLGIDNYAYVIGIESSKKGIGLGQAAYLKMADIAEAVLSTNHSESAELAWSALEKNAPELGYTIHQRKITYPMSKAKGDGWNGEGFRYDRVLVKNDVKSNPPRKPTVSFSKSTRKEKKMVAVFTYNDGRTKTTHFGAKGMSDYTIHKDPKRKQRYITRHRKRENWDDYTSAGSLSRYILWGEPTLRASKDAYLKRFDLKEVNANPRDYEKEYELYGSSKEAIEYRSELNKYNREMGTYGNGDGLDASHVDGEIVGFEEASKNRGRREKSRLKKNPPKGITIMSAILRFDLPRIVPLLVAVELLEDKGFELDRWGEGYKGGGFATLLVPKTITEENVRIKIQQNSKMVMLFSGHKVTDEQQKKIRQLVLDAYTIKNNPAAAIKKPRKLSTELSKILMGDLIPFDYVSAIKKEKEAEKRRVEAEKKADSKKKADTKKKADKPKESKADNTFIEMLRFSAEKAGKTADELTKAIKVSRVGKIDSIEKVKKVADKLQIPVSPKTNPPVFAKPEKISGKPGGAFITESGVDVTGRHYKGAIISAGLKRIDVDGEQEVPKPEPRSSGRRIKFNMLRPKTYDIIEGDAPFDGLKEGTWLIAAETSEGHIYIRDNVVVETALTLKAFPKKKSEPRLRPETYGSIGTFFGDRVVGRIRIKSSGKVHPVFNSQRVMGGYKENPYHAPIALSAKKKIHTQVEKHNALNKSSIRQTTNGAVEQAYQRGGMSRVRKFLNLLLTNNPPKETDLEDVDLVPEGHPLKKKAESLKRQAASGRIVKPTVEMFKQAFGFPRPGDKFIGYDVEDFDCRRIMVQRNQEYKFDWSIVLAPAQISKSKLEKEMKKFSNKKEMLPSPKRLTYLVHAANEFTVDKLDSNRVIISGHGRAFRIKLNPVSILDKDGEVYINDHAPMTKKKRDNHYNKEKLKGKVGSDAFMKQLADKCQTFGEGSGYAKGNYLYFRRGTPLKNEVRVDGTMIEGADAFYHTHPAAWEPSQTSPEDFMVYHGMFTNLGITDFFTVFGDRLDWFTFPKSERFEANEMAEIIEDFENDIEAVFNTSQDEYQEKMGDKPFLVPEQTRYINKMLCKCIPEYFAKYRCYELAPQTILEAAKNNPPIETTQYHSKYLEQLGEIKPVKYAHNGKTTEAFIGKKRYALADFMVAKAARMVHNDDPTDQIDKSSKDWSVMSSNDKKPEWRNARKYQKISDRRPHPAKEYNERIVVLHPNEFKGKGSKSARYEGEHDKMQMLKAYGLNDFAINEIREYLSKYTGKTSNFHIMQMLNLYRNVNKIGDVDEVIDDLCSSLTSEGIKQKSKEIKKMVYEREINNNSTKEVATKQAEVHERMFLENAHKIMIEPLACEILKKLVKDRQDLTKLELMEKMRDRHGIHFISLSLHAMIHAMLSPLDSPKSAFSGMDKSDYLSTIAQNLNRTLQTAVSIPV